MTDVREVLVERPEGVRRALVRAPDGVSQVIPRPVVVLLHGAGGTASLAMGNTGWADLADREGLLLVYPEGTRRDPAAPPRFLQNPQAWNDGSGRGHTARTGVDDVGFLRALIEQVVESKGVDPDRLYLAGFSNGASMAFRAGAELAGVIAAIGPVAGHCWVNPPESAHAGAGADDLRRRRSPQPSGRRRGEDPMGSGRVPSARARFIRPVARVQWLRREHRASMGPSRGCRSMPATGCRAGADVAMPDRRGSRAITGRGALGSCRHGWRARPACGSTAPPRSVGSSGRIAADSFVSLTRRDRFPVMHPTRHLPALLVSARWSCLAACEGRRAPSVGTPEAGGASAAREYPNPLSEARLRADRHRGPALPFSRADGRLGHPPVLRIHELPRRLPRDHGQHRRGAAQAARRGGAAGDRGVRHHRPGPRHAGGAAGVARSLRPAVHRADRHAGGKSIRRRRPCTCHTAYREDPVDGQPYTVAHAANVIALHEGRHGAVRLSVRHAAIGMGAGNSPSRRLSGPAVTLRSCAPAWLDRLRGRWPRHRGARCLRL